MVKKVLFTGEQPLKCMSSIFFEILRKILQFMFYSEKAFIRRIRHRYIVHVKQFKFTSEFAFLVQF